MCIIVHKPAGIALDPIIYRNCFLRNDHGAGIAFVDQGKLIIKKGIHSVKKFVEIVTANEDKELVIHCRLMSKGEISDENCHPFAVESENFPNMSFAVVHNGTLPWKSTAEKSDTSHFVEEAIKPILDRDAYFFDYGIYRSMMGAFVGSSNKLCIMRFNNDKEENKEGTPEVFFVNRHEGIEYQGCWFSNLSFTEEFSRFVNDHDRKRIDSWKPKAWVEKVTTVYNNTGTFNGVDAWNINRAEKEAADWRFDRGTPAKRGFGWYNINVSYTGRRNIKEFCEANGIKPDMAPPVKKDAPVDDEDLDEMKYLSSKEMTDIRSLCIDIIKDSYPDFELTACSTIELGAWARQELRTLVPDLNSTTNQKLMHTILYGDAPVTT